MFKSVFAAGVAVALSSGSALATSAKVEPNTAARAPAPSATAAPTTARKPTRYCMETTTTGSRLSRTLCETREGWLRRGVDPLVR